MAAFDPDAYLAATSPPAASFDPDAYLRGGQAQAAPQTPPQPDALDRIGRAAGLMSRGLVTGMASPSLAIGEGVNELYKMLANQPQRSGVFEGFSDFLTRAGLPQPGNATERIAGDIWSGLGGAGGFMGMVGGAKSATPGLIDSLVANLGRQLAAATTASTAAGGTREAGGGPYAQLAAGLAGGMLPYATQAVRGSHNDIAKQYADRRAAEIIDQVAGNDIGAIRSATANAPANVTTAQAAAGVKNELFDALGDTSRNMDRTSYYRRLFEAQRQARIDDAARIAGGQTQTTARQSAGNAQKTLNAVTTPMRDIELAAANTAGTTGYRLQSEVERMAALASGKVEDVRRLSGAQQTAENLAQSGRMRLDSGAPPAQGLPRVPGRYSYGTELAQRADDAASNSANTSLLAGDSARFAQMRADSLAAHGLKPLDTQKIVSSINAKINDPTIGPNSLNSRVLRNVGELVDEWTVKNGGVIDARALYEIRKSAVNNEVERLLAGVDPKSQSKRASQLLSQVRPLIDDAIESAGGTGWRRYLNTYEMGMRQIEQQKLGAKAMELLERSPKDFVRLVSGNDPRTVKKIFSSEFDIDSAMTPNQMNRLRQSASEITRDESIASGAASGNAALADLLKQNSATFRIPNFLNPKITLANRALAMAEDRVNRDVMMSINNAMRNPTEFNNLMNSVPATQRPSLLRLIAQNYSKIPSNFSGGYNSNPTLQGLLSQQSQGQQ